MACHNLVVGMFFASQNCSSYLPLCTGVSKKITDRQCCLKRSSYPHRVPVTAWRRLTLPVTPTHLYTFPPRLPPQKLPLPHLGFLSSPPRQLLPSECLACASFPQEANSPKTRSARTRQMSARVMRSKAHTLAAPFQRWKLLQFFTDNIYEV